MWRQRAIRWGWVIVALNLSISLLNIWFGYNHMVKQEYWTMAISWTITLINGYVAWFQYTNIRKYQQELKDIMWKALSTPSEALR